MVCYKGKGCAVCNGSGYKGRIALYEVMVMNETLKELVLNGVSAAELKRAAINEGMKTLRMSGLQKVQEGTSTIEEILRVTMAD
jgi:type IV pilus assembly protein PilB